MAAFDSTAQKAVLCNVLRLDLNIGVYEHNTCHTSLERLNDLFTDLFVYFVIYFLQIQT